jgi:DNA-directed RNA polymerase
MVERDYSELIYKTNNALRELVKINSFLLDELIAIFVRNTLPEVRRKAAIEEMKPLVKDILDRRGEKNSDNKLRGETLRIYNYIQLVMEQLDKANCGFLTGDLSAKLLNWMMAYSSELTAQVEKESLSLNLNQTSRNELLSDYFSKLFKVSSDCNFKLPVNGIPMPDSENPRNLFERQLVLEDETNQLAIDKFMELFGSLTKMNKAHELSFARANVSEWFLPMCKAIKAEQERCMEQNLAGDRANYAQYLLKLAPEKLAMISLIETIKLVIQIAIKSGEDTPVTSNSGSYYIISKVLFEAIGKSINSQIQYDIEEFNIEKKIKEELQKTSKPGDKAFLLRRSDILKKNATEKILRARTPERLQILSKLQQLQLGSLMTYMIKETATVMNSVGNKVPLLSLGYAKASATGITNKLIGVCKVNEDFILKLINEMTRKDSMFIQLSRSLPMVYKPAPWVEFDVGGYYQKPTSVMRLQGSHLQEKVVKFADMGKVYNVLDILAQTPWRINMPILKVAEEFWEQGGGAGEIPERFYNFQDYIYEYQLIECINTADRRKLLQKIQLQKDVNSLRCSFLLKLEQARAFSKVSKIYYPYNIDFRGRVYPVPPHLNHISSDICRGLLEFGEGRPLGKAGLRWLKIHLANKMGKDKLPNDDRAAYTESVLPMIERIVADPLKHREWLQVEDCWQSLSAMFDLHAALKSGDPERYISHLHIHQDGSCNGLQHYAALGRDYDGAYQVNLVNRDIPGDLYTFIANMVEKRVSADCLNSESEHYQLALKLKGNIKRKIIKQTVMTTVYGVTFIGAKQQIQKQLRDKDFLDQTDDNESYKASVYLAKLTLDCVANLFTQAHEIKQWLKDCSRTVGEYGFPMSWVTPLG